MGGAREAKKLVLPKPNLLFPSQIDVEMVPLFTKPVLVAETQKPLDDRLYRIKTVVQIDITIVTVQKEEMHILILNSW